MQNLFENILLAVGGVAVGYIFKPVIDKLIELVGNLVKKD